MLQRSFLIASLLLCCGISAQTDQGRLVGTAMDTLGAVIPNVTITVTNPSTALQRTTTSNEQGTYVVTGLLPGMYKVVAKGNGLGPTEYTEIRVGVGQERVLNVILQPAS